MGVPICDVYDFGLTEEPAGYLITGQLPMGWDTIGRVGIDGWRCPFCGRPEPHNRLICSGCGGGRQLGRTD